MRSCQIGLEHGTIYEPVRRLNGIRQLYSIRKGGHKDDEESKTVDVL